MSLLNYTTGISVNKTLAEITNELVTHGATAVMTEYDDQGYIIALNFKVLVNGQSVAFRLPSDWRPVLKILESDKKVAKGRKTQDQALRVAWRIILAWVKAQMAIIETNMVTTDQVFLPYAITNNGKTVYEEVQNKRLLLGGS